MRHRKRRKSPAAFRLHHSALAHKRPDHGRSPGAANRTARCRGDESGFDNPDGDLVYDPIPEAAYERVFDFGCSCADVSRGSRCSAAAPFDGLVTVPPNSN